MKKIIYLAFVTLLFANCKKQVLQNKVSSVPSNLFYRILEKDLDDSLTYSKVLVTTSARAVTISSDNSNGPKSCSTENKTNNWYLEHCTVTPVTFISSSATLNDDNSISIKWETGVEQNVKVFIIQRSEDGKSYKEIGETNPKGVSGVGASYIFVDNTFL